LVAVVDFGQQRRLVAMGIYEGWGRIQQLEPPIDQDVVRRDPILTVRFFGRGASGLQGTPIRLSPEEGKAIARIAGGLPPQAFPVDEPTYDEEIVFWAGDDKGPPEAVLEHEIHARRRLWSALGFPSAPHKQRCLPSGRRPDLRAPGVVADVKRRVTRNDGPAQVEKYLEELDVESPENSPWRGLLVHQHDDLDKATRDRVVASTHQIEVWRVSDGGLGRRSVKRLA
jgi:hypothetical protein